MPTPVTGVSAVSGPGIDTRTATSRGRSHAASASHAAASGRARRRVDRRRRREGNTAQSYRPSGGATTECHGGAGAEPEYRQPHSGPAGGLRQRLRVGHRPIRAGADGGPAHPAACGNRRGNHSRHPAHDRRSGRGGGRARDRAEMGCRRARRDRRRAEERRYGRAPRTPAESRARDGAHPDRSRAGARGHRHGRSGGADPSRRHGSAAGAGGVRPGAGEPGSRS